MTSTKRIALAALALVASHAGCLAGTPDTSARERFAAACAEDLDRLCSVRHLGGDEAVVTCHPITRASATPACVAADDALRASRL